MEALSASQKGCLQWLARHGTSEDRHCSARVLEQLHRLGLVERVVQGWLPLENPHAHYVISAAGKALLERLARK
jgi:DNA-binding HxlR family transcriptional regulator